MNLSPPGVVVHPTIPVLQQAQKDDGRSGHAASLGRRHMLFSGLVDMILATMRERPRDIEFLGQYLLVKTSMEEMRDDEFFSSIIPYRGFIELMVSLITTFREALVTSEDLFRAAPEMGDSCRKYEALAALYREYLTTLREGPAWDRGRHAECDALWDEAGKKMKALELLESPEALPLIDSLEEISFENIYRLSALDFRLITTLAARALRLSPDHPQKITFRLPYDPYRQDAYRYLERTVLQFEHLADSLPPLTLDFLPGGAPEPLLTARDYLKAHLFTPPEDLIEVIPVKADATVRLIRGGDMEDEVAEICREIRVLLEGGAAPRDIVVAFRSLVGYGEIVAQEGKKFSIPFTFPRGNPLLSSHLVRILLAPFRIIGSRFSSREVLEFLSSSFIDCSCLSGSGPPLSESDLDDLVRGAGIVDDGSLPWETALERYRVALIEEEEDEGDRSGKRALLLEKIGRAAAVIASLRAILRPLAQEAPVHRFTGILKGFIRSFEVERNVLAPRAALAGTAWPLDLLQRDMSALEGFVRTLSDIERTFRALRIETKLTTAEFYDLLVESLRGAHMAAPGDQDGIRVLDAYELVGYRAPVLFVGGLAEGSFPVRHSQDVLFPDEEKEEMAAILGRKLFISTAMSHWEDYLLFFNAVNTAENTLYLTHPTRDEKGETLMPSYFLEQVCDLVREEQDGMALVARDTTGARGLPSPSQLFRKADLETYLTYSLWRPAGETGGTDVLPLLGGYLEERNSGGRLEWIFQRCATERHRESFLMAAQDGAHCSFFGAIAQKDLLEHLAQRWGRSHRWSASQLEDYGRCPFVFFMKRVLRVEKAPMPEREIDAASAGTLIHEILERFYRRLRDENLLAARDEGALLNLMRTMADEIFQEWERSRPTGDPHFWEIRKQSILRTLLLWLGYDLKPSPFTPCCFEMEFGTGESGEFSFQGADGLPLLFTGKIDRVDVDESTGSIRVIDYKNSKSQTYKEKIKGKNIGTLSFQVPLYAMAAASILEKKGLKATARSRIKSGYALLRKPEYLAQDFNDDEFLTYFSTDSELISSPGEGRRSFPLETSLIVGRIREGWFVPTGVNCDYCDYGEVCRFRMEGEEEHGQDKVVS
ncbi:MAG: PD-(D/E)XK nuclease family protein [Candidatus Eremiobacteraeota bacterium]|nr:PD-(D/E)XK nuclease family protein [Candidatus Eremiobacteraeota bacterium]